MPCLPPLYLWGTNLETWKKNCGLHLIVLGAVWSPLKCLVCSRCFEQQFKLCHWPRPHCFCVLRFLRLKAHGPVCSLHSWCLHCTCKGSVCKFLSFLEPLHCTNCDVNNPAPALLHRLWATHLTGLWFPLKCLYLTNWKIKDLCDEKTCAIS